MNLGMSQSDDRQQLCENRAASPSSPSSRTLPLMLGVLTTPLCGSVVGG